MANFRTALLFNESAMFLAVQLIALFTGINLINTGQAPPRQEPITSLQGLFAGSWQILLGFAVAVVLIIVLLKFIKTPFLWSGFFAFLIFVGAQAVFGSFLPLLASIVLAIAVVAVRWWKPNIITHNLAIFLGVAGIAAILGLALRVEVVIFLLVVLSVYDFIAVFKTKHMVSMFRDLMKRGTPLAIVVPESPLELRSRVEKITRKKLHEIKKQKEDKKILMLGTGDLAFPGLFAVSAFADTNSLFIAGAVIAGAIIGILFNHYLLFIKKYKFIPALPFIAAFSIIGYLIAVLPNFII